MGCWSKLCSTRDLAWFRSILTLVARRRGPARKKDDAEDARICCLLALDRHAGLRALIPHGELGGELRAIARDDERAARDQRRLLNRLRADLQTTYPAALVLALACAVDWTVDVWRDTPDWLAGVLSGAVLGVAIGAAVVLLGAALQRMTDTRAALWLA